MMTSVVVVTFCLSVVCLSASGSAGNSTVSHRRPRRYLIYEKGSAVTITVSAVTSFLPRIPQGMNFISEHTVYYELPSSTVIPTTPRPRSTTTKPPWTQVKWPAYTPYWDRAYSWHHRRLHKRDADSFDFEDIGSLFFHQLSRFAENYGFNSRHCVMRTICEAKHILYPKGQSLFHDIIRIILEYSLPSIIRDKRYAAASRVDNHVQCANLYGPHCRISFLDYFTVQVHGKFM